MLSISPPFRQPRAFTAAYGFVGTEWVANPYIEIDSQGNIVQIQSGVPSDGLNVLYDLGQVALLPGLINAHSHAFQQKLRGIAQRTSKSNATNFWSWRDLMYQLVEELTPESFFAITKTCYEEMLSAGITCVGEFHYLHHLQAGSTYSDPNEFSWQVIRAAEETGIRLVLLDVYYARGGFKQDLTPPQRRFCDASVEHYLARVDNLREQTRKGNFSLGLAPHSVRAVHQRDLEVIASYAKNHNLVIHAHVSEQSQENAGCEAEYGCTPLKVFAQSGCLDRPRMFTAVHGIHVNAEDVALLTNQCVCACPTTEADLGDGIIPASVYQKNKVHLALGSDSNMVVDLIQEARLLEMNERLSQQRRVCLQEGEKSLGQTLLEIATIGSACSLGQPHLGKLVPGSPFDACTVSLAHPLLANVPAPFVLDALFTAGTSGVIEQVFVGGRRLR